MLIYSQRDHSWGLKQLGGSGLEMQHFGCLITDIAQALMMSGYAITPGDVVDKLSSIGGFTDEHYKESSAGAGDGVAGLLWWNKLTEAYPQIHLDGGRYIFAQGTWGRYLHWVLKSPSGEITDPFFGLGHEPVGFSENGQTRSIRIDPPAQPTPQPAQEPPLAPVNTLPTVDVNLKPDALWESLKGGADTYQDRVQVKRLQDRLIAEETLPEYDRLAMEGDGHGYYGNITTRAVVQLQVAKGIIPEGSSYPSTYGAGWTGPKTRGFINA